MSTGFLVRLVGALVLVALLYVSFDILKRLDDLQGEAAGEMMGALGAYYSRVLPLFLLELVPGLVLIAAGMVLVKMAAARELLALKASGTSLYRVVAPIFLWTFLLSVAVFVLRERLGPGSVEESAMIKHVLNDPLESHLMLSDDGFSRKVFVGLYDFTNESMERVMIMETDPEDGHIRKTWWAQRGHWGAPGELVLLDVIVQEFGDAGSGPIHRASAAGRVVLPTSISPVDILEAADQGSDSPATFLTLGELRHYARVYPGVLHFRVSYHARLASFFSPIVLLLVGIPCLIGFERSVNSRLLGTIVGIVLAGGLYALTFVFNSMGTTGTLSPVAACWLPPVVGGAVGLWLFESMLT